MTIMAAAKVVLEEDKESEVELSDADDEGSNSEIGSDNDENTTNAGWADSISKILRTNKPKGKKTLVLSKAKKLSDVKKRTVKSAGFEVETADGDVEEQEVIEEELSEEKGPPKKKKKELPNVRVKPNILERDRERLLSKIATKGVVQLFNAVKMQQKDISNKLKEAGPLEVRQEKVMKNIDKRAFLDVLMGEKSTRLEEETEKTSKKTTKSEKESTWDVLKDDFMMSAKLKDWDKELEEEEEDEREAEEEMESD